MSRESKEEVLAQVDASLDEAWAEAATAYMIELAKRKKYVTIDDLWGAIERGQVPAVPGIQSKVGIVPRRLSKSAYNVLRATEYRCFSERGNHDNIMLWESRIFEGGNDTMPEVVQVHARDGNLASMVKIYERARAFDAKRKESGQTFTDELDSLLATIYETFE